MKKLLIVVLAVLALLSFVSCKEKPAELSEIEYLTFRLDVEAAECFSLYYSEIGSFGLEDLGSNVPYYFTNHGSGFSTSVPGCSVSGNNLTFPEITGNRNYPSFTLTITPAATKPYFDAKKYTVTTTNGGSFTFDETKETYSASIKEFSDTIKLPGIDEEDHIVHIKNSTYTSTGYENGLITSYKKHIEVTDTYNNKSVFKYDEGRKIVEYASFNGVDVTEFVQAMYNAGKY